MYRCLIMLLFLNQLLQDALSARVHNLALKFRAEVPRDLLIILRTPLHISLLASHSCHTGGLLSSTSELDVSIPGSEEFQRLFRA